MARKRLCAVCGVARWPTPADTRAEKEARRRFGAAPDRTWVCDRCFQRLLAAATAMFAAEEP